jgi:hypothetical protein
MTRSLGIRPTRCRTWICDGRPNESGGHLSRGIHSPRPECRAEGLPARTPKSRGRPWSTLLWCLADGHVMRAREAPIVRRQGRVTDLWKVPFSPRLSHWPFPWSQSGIFSRSAYRPRQASVLSLRRPHDRGFTARRISTRPFISPASTSGRPKNFSIGSKAAGSKTPSFRTKPGEGFRFIAIKIDCDALNGHAHCSQPASSVPSSALINRCSSVRVG